MFVVGCTLTLNCCTLYVGPRITRACDLYYHSCCISGAYHVSSIYSPPKMLHFDFEVGVLTSTIIKLIVRRRTTYIPKHKLLRKFLGQPPMTPEEHSRFLNVLAMDSLSSMGSEISAIVTATAIKLLMFEHRVLWDFGFDLKQPPDVPAELTGM